MSHKITFAPPDDRCLLLLQNDHQWIAYLGDTFMQNQPATDRLAWEKSIKIQDPHATVKTILVACAQRPASFNYVKKTVNEQLAKGFTKVYGHMNDVTAAGTKWLKISPSAWRYMDSASKEQLETLKSAGLTGDLLLLETLAAHGYFGPTRNVTYGGPSILEKRWIQIFPEVMTHAKLCKELGLEAKEIYALWSSAKGNTQAMHFDLPNMDCI